MENSVKLTSLTVAACPALPPGVIPAGVAVAERPDGSLPSLGGTRLRGTGLSDISGPLTHGSRVSDGGVAECAEHEVSERPTQALAVAVAQAHAYAAAHRAGTRQAWIEAATFAFAGGADSASVKQQMTRAFRGLEPWRDPA